MYIGQIAKDIPYISMRITDNGTGMSRAVMEHIFEPFFTTKPVDKGTGLGLATVQGVVLGHSGAMIVESELDKGTSFQVYLPAKEPSSKPEAIDVDATGEKVAASVLLVEDQEDVQNMMISMLERFGFDVSICSNGFEALSVIKDSPGYYDLVVTDHGMPKMTGVELVQKAFEIAPDLPFILISGYSREKLRDMMKDHPSIKAVLRKPIVRKALYENIVRILLDKAGNRKNPA
jgi:CheY-like chemotaxis protein